MKREDRHHKSKAVAHMSISMHQASIPQFIRMLGNISSIIDKTRIHAESRKIDESVFLNARLAPDMYPLSRQIQIVIDMAKTCSARLAGIDAPYFGNDQITFSELQNRISRTIDFLQGIDRVQIDGSYDKPITFRLEGKEIVYLGQDYLLENIIPHFYFHVTAAYDILRHHGVELGKNDYLDNE